MRIAFDVSYIHKQRTGYGRSALELLKALLGYDTYNSYILHGWSYALDVKEIQQLQRENVKISVRRIPGFLKRFYWNRVKFPPIEFFIGEHDIYHNTDPLLPPAKNNVRVITVHDLSYKIFPQFFEHNVLRWDSFIVRSVQLCDAIIVPSLQTKMDVTNIFKTSADKIHVIRFPVSSKFSSDSHPIDEEVERKFQLNVPFALFVGTLEPRKNIPRLIKAFEMLHKDNQVQLHLVLAGKRGWLYQQIIEAILHSPVRKKIHYLEYVSDDDLASLYRLSEFVVFPSMYEGYGFPVLEAMASGKAVITSNTSSMKEVGEGAALLTDPYNVAELAQAMKILHHDESQRRVYEQRGIEHMRKFSSQQAAQNLLTVYQSLSRQ